MNEVIVPAQNPATRPMLALGADQIKLIKDTVAEGATDLELQLFLHQARRTGLDPLARQIYCQFRWSQAQDRNSGNWKSVRRMTIQTSIDGFRLIAERTGLYAGQIGPFWCGPDGTWSEIWLGPGQPYAAKIAILRKDFKEPLWAVARFAAYVGTKNDGSPNSVWQKLGDLMIAKCVEALGLRRAFPQELSGLYTDDEMAQARDPIEEAGKEPAAAPDAMARPTPASRPAASSPTAAENAKPANGPSQNSRPQERASGAAPAAAPKRKKLTIQEVDAIKQLAFAAARQGSANFDVFWKNLDSVDEREVVKGNGSDLRKLMTVADKELQKQMEESAAESAHEAQEAAEWVDQETGEIKHGPVSTKYSGPNDPSIGD